MSAAEIALQNYTGGEGSAKASANINSAIAPIQAAATRNAILTQGHGY